MNKTTADPMTRDELTMKISALLAGQGVNLHPDHLATVAAALRQQSELYNTFTLVHGWMRRELPDHYVVLVAPYNVDSYRQAEGSALSGFRWTYDLISEIAPVELPAK